VGRHVIVAGTGFEGRASIIRNHCSNGQRVELRREPSNRHDPNAIAVYIEAPRLFGLLGKGLRQIGYIKAPAAGGLSKRMDEGLKVEATVASFYAPPDRDHPRVSLNLEYTES
jgi:HIRAN domain